MPGLNMPMSAMQEQQAITVPEKGSIKAISCTQRKCLAMSCPSNCEQEDDRLAGL